ncbi:MAG: carboxymuconolactone decarboxylase family protein [Deltaproteobacteria bacterium]|nr:MAG: carboxymuconolactone decarboxylase family protein [Deltaproteobacteria bacterium]
MYLPKIYQVFSENFQEVFEGYRKLGTACRAGGPLDEKSQDLVKLGIAVGTNSRGAVMSHTRKALGAGATKEELFHVILLSLTTIGFPKMIAAMGWVQEALDKQDPDR